MRLVVTDVVLFQWHPLFKHGSFQLIISSRKSAVQFKLCSELLNYFLSRKALSKKMSMFLVNFCSTLTVFVVITYCKALSQVSLSLYNLLLGYCKVLRYFHDLQYIESETQKIAELQHFLISLWIYKFYKLG